MDDQAHKVRTSLRALDAHPTSSFALERRPRAMLLGAYSTRLTLLLTCEITRLPARRVLQRLHLHIATCRAP